MRKAILICAALVICWSGLALDDDIFRPRSYKNKCYKELGEFAIKAQAIMKESRGQDQERRLTDLRIEYKAKMDPIAFPIAKEWLENYLMWIQTGDRRYLALANHADKRALGVCKDYKDGR